MQAREEAKAFINISRINKQIKMKKTGKKIVRKKIKLENGVKQNRRSSREEEGRSRDL